MRLFKIITPWMVAVSGMGIFLASCEKTFNEKIVKQDDFSNSSLVRVFLATVNANRNYVYVDAKPVTGSVLASGGTFPSTSAFAAALTPGVRAFLVRDTLGTSTQVPLSFATNMEGGKYYSIFVYDTINAPKQKTVETKFVVPTDTSSRIRFANFIYNPTTIPNIDIFSFRLNANIFTNVPVTGVTDFIPYPSGYSGLLDTLYVRETGTSVSIIKLAVGGSTFLQKRNYTLMYRGSHRGTRVATLYPDM